MAESYNKNCRFCHTQIEMNNWTGRWLPYSITTGKFHDCPKRGNR
jgi:hypothetical protein